MSKKQAARKGAGRPPKYGKSTKLDVRLPDDMVAALMSLAGDQGVTRSDVIVAELRKSRSIKAKMESLTNQTASE